jgi:DNA recombination protein RmuC
MTTVLPLTLTLVVAAFIVGAAVSWLVRERAGVEQKMLSQFEALAHQVFSEERSAVEGAITPVKGEFERFSQAVASLQQATASDLGALRASLSQVTQLQTQLQEAVRTTNDTTGQLRTALQNPHTVGNWGEISLERIVELAGMTEHCDFDRQTGVRSSDGTGERPDLLVHLTGGLHIPVDAKASVTNYINAVHASAEVERTRFLDLSCRDLKARVTELRGRAYNRIDGYAGMTFLFVPNESMLSAALSREPAIVEEAARHHIVVCSPLLLLCYLQAFANGWRIQKQQENAEEVARRGKMLHDRLQAFFASLGKVGWYLNHTVEKFNTSVGKMDNLLVPGRELGRLLGINDELEPVNSVDTAVREVRYADEESPALGAVRAG